MPGLVMWYFVHHSGIHTTIAGGLTATMGLGILSGLMIGKPLGIFLFSWAAVKARLGNSSAGAPNDLVPRGSRPISISLIERQWQLDDAAIIGAAQMP